MTTLKTLLKKSLKLTFCIYAALYLTACTSGLFGKSHHTRFMEMNAELSKTDPELAGKQLQAYYNRKEMDAVERRRQYREEAAAQREFLQTQLIIKQLNE